MFSNSSKQAHIPYTISFEFISVILFVITVVIGVTFTRQKSALSSLPVIEADSAWRAVEAPRRKTLTEISVADAFMQEGVLEEPLLPVIELLKRHDVFALIEIAYAEVPGKNAPLSIDKPRALAKAVELSKFFLRHGVSLEAVRILVKAADAASSSLVVRMYVDE